VERKVLAVSHYSKLQQGALAYLDNHTVITLATYGLGGVWAAALFYANDLFDIYFLSAGHTRHAMNMASNNRVSGTIQENYRKWESIKGIQLEGFVEKLVGVDLRNALNVYARKFPLITEDNEPIKAALSGVNWYRLRPDRLYLIDNSKGFGHRDEINLTSQ